MTSKPANKPSNERGIVFAVTGEKYNILARRAARALRLVMPETPIDLFTDADPQDGVFDQTHLLECKTHRPKMEAIRRSRFERTIYLDADIIVVADISDVFDLLDRFDFVGAHARASNQPLARRKITEDIPIGFPQINSGVIGAKRGKEVSQLTQKWEDLLNESDDNVDQPYLRRAIYDSKLAIGILPPEYNLIFLNQLAMWSDRMNAPRILHARSLHLRKNAGDPDQAFRVEEILSPRYSNRLKKLIAADVSLGGDANLVVRPMSGESVLYRLRLRLARLWE